MRSHTTRSFIAASALVFGAALAIPAVAQESVQQEHWNQTHPGRVDLNQRLHEQNVIANHKEAAGDISHAQAEHIYNENRQISREERGMARQDGGHLTPREGQDLNRQESSVNAQSRTQ